MRSRRSRWWCGPLGLAMAVACAGNDPAVLVRVHLDPGSVSRCVVVVARGADGGTGKTAPLDAAPGQDLTVAAFRGGLGGVVTLQAQGYSAADCSSTADELSEQRTASFAPGAAQSYGLTLQPEGLCTDGADGDHDGLVDCQDPACQADPACVPDGGTSAFAYAPSNFSPADFSAPGAGLVIDCDAGYDTGSQVGWFCGAPTPTSYVVDGGAPGPMLLMPVRSLTITSTGQWRITGTRPLVLAVYGGATIDGPLFAGAVGASHGPGGSRPACPGTGGPGVDGYNGGGGGGGGGYAGQGGNGTVSAGSQAAGGDGGTVFGPASLIPLLGGCSGGPGGMQINSTVSLFEGGGGGGAIQISAAGSLVVSSAIGVPGGAGRGTALSSNNGGGGGGSGGAILLEAQQLVFSPAARVTANGGGGAEGCDSSAATGCASGEDGRTDGPFPARGGNSGRVTPGGDGGAGTSAATPGTYYLGGEFGGGGGGGSVGRLRVNAVNGCTIQGPPAMTFSPPATSNKAGDAGCP